jgi:4-hydroxy-3-methylbut-2-enyl diphosphate reductase
VQVAEDLRAEWLEGAQTVGITAGTSTPDEVIQRIEESIREFAAKREEQCSRVP